MRLHNLSNRLLLVTAIALLPALLVVAIGVVQLQQAAETALHDYSKRSAEHMALELERIVSGAENVLRAVALTSEVRDGDLRNCSNLLEDVVADLPFLASIVVINFDGSIRCIPRPSTGIPSLADRQYFQTALTTSELVIGEYTIGRRNKTRVLPVALRIGGTTGATIGVAVAYISLDWLQQRLVERSYEEGSSLTIADRNGTILARIPEPERFIGTVIPGEYQRLLTMSEAGSLEVVSQDGTRRVIGYYPVRLPPEGLYVSAGHATAVAYASYRRLALVAGIIAAGGILLAFGLARYTSEAFIARPVNRVLSTIGAWRSGDQTARTGLRPTDGEICAAGASLDVFLDELEQSRAAQKRAEARSALLSEELDHRIKNLLTMVQVVARRTFNGSADTEKLGIFSGRISALGGANGMLRQSDWQHADLRELLSDSLRPFADPIGARVRMTGPKILVKGKVALALAMAIHELATNASKYGALSSEAGRVQINWSRESIANGTFVLTWQEDGGPVVVIPKKQGFGSKVITEVLAGQLGATVELEFRPTGLVCTIQAPASAIEEPAEPRVRAAS